MTDTPTIPLRADEDLPEGIRETLSSLPTANVFRMVANAPASLQPFLELVHPILVDADLRQVGVLPCITQTLA